MESECERNLGEIALGAGNLQAAQARFARSLKVCRDAEDKRTEAIALWCMGKTDIASGDQDLARKRLGEALCAFRVLEMRAEALDCLEDCALLLQGSGDFDIAVRLQAATASVRSALALARSSRNEARWQANVAAARASLGEPAFNAAWADGTMWALDKAIDHALASTTAPTVAA
jgi:tetratricopeptide (TPR) repeat protein